MNFMMTVTPEMDKMIEEEMKRRGLTSKQETVRAIVSEYLKTKGQDR